MPLVGLKKDIFDPLTKIVILEVLMQLIMSLVIHGGNLKNKSAL